MRKTQDWKGAKAAISLEFPKSTSMTTELENMDKDDRLVVHMKYHLRGIRRQQFRTIFDQTCNIAIQQQMLKE